MNTVNTPYEDPSSDPTALWAQARAWYLAHDFPEYGSLTWRELPPDDPRRYAAVLDAAEHWRRRVAHQRWLDSLDDDAWFAEVTREANAEARRVIKRLDLANGRSHAELTAARQHLPSALLEATPGWPPIAIPGQPGRYLTYGNDEEVA
ncbi:DUF2742 domain-containing protein [Streptomyces klenkii]|uniref:DUF2742 domain-containing protein n=1 Tax=Streptomyces klenkii TaxID=1420899 RepID=UPI0036E2DBDB